MNDFFSGFTSGTPWLTVNPNFEQGINVADQEKDNPAVKHLQVYKKLAKLRHSASILFGSMDTNVQV